MSLQEDIQALQENFLRDAPQEAIDIIMHTTADLVSTGIADRALKTGDTIPAFTLPNAVGDTVNSQELLAAGPLVLNFYRGGWCPYCNLELQAFQSCLPEIRACGAQLVAISPNLPDKSLNTIEKHALAFEVLSDLHNSVARKFGLVFTLDDRLKSLYERFGIDISAFNGDNSFELPIPATYVVDSGGIIRQSFVDADYSRRLEPAAVVDVLNSMN